MPEDMLLQRFYATGAPYKQTLAAGGGGTVAGNLQGLYGVIVIQMPLSVANTLFELTALFPNPVEDAILAALFAKYGIKVMEVAGQAGKRMLAKVVGKGTKALTEAEIRLLHNEYKDALRKAAREIWEKRTGRRAFWDGMDVHHRIPLEYAHLFPKSDPNRVSNLIGMTAANHTDVTNAWNAWKLGLKGRVPTQAEIVEQAIRIDTKFGNLMKFLP